MTKPISKIDGARRQLETSIKLYFDGSDSLSVHTLAWAAFKVLFDVYPHHNDDGFSNQLDLLLKKEGWAAMAGVANFLKHADRDPDAILKSHHPEQAFIIIGLGTLLYKRAVGEMTIVMMGFDNWVEWIGADDLGIVELDTNEERVAEENKFRNNVKKLPYEEQLVYAQIHFQYFVESFETVRSDYDKAIAGGESLQSLLDGIHNNDG